MGMTGYGWKFDGAGKLALTVAKIHYENGDLSFNGLIYFIFYDMFQNIPSFVAYNTEIVCKKIMTTFSPCVSGLMPCRLFFMYLLMSESSQ